MTDKERLESHVEWLRGDHEQCNPWLADTIEELMAENARLRDDLKVIMETPDEEIVTSAASIARAAISYAKTSAPDNWRMRWWQRWDRRIR